LVMDEQAKTRWQRAKPPGVVVGLPGYLVGGEWVGVSGSPEAAVHTADAKTMDDFEYAVETGTLPSFLKQDVDLGPDASASTSANKSGGIAEAELERLMREMSEGDLDKLAEQIGVEQSASKVGLISESTAKAVAATAPPPPPASTSTKPPEPLATASPKIPDIATATSPLPPITTSRKNSLINPVERKSRASMEEKAEVAREMMEAGTVDGLMKAVEKAEGKEKLD